MIKFHNAMVALAAAASLVGATASQAAVRPQAVSMRAAPVALGKPAMRAGAVTQNSSKFAAGLPLILVLVGAVAIVATVIVATDGDSSPR